MQSYLVKTQSGTLNLTEISSLTNLPASFFIPELNWLIIAAEKESIGIAQIKEAVKWLTSLKANAAGKIILINQADLLTVEAQNALLKSLEEPGDNNRFLLAVNSPDTLLETIVSRCQYINLTTTTAKLLIDPQKINLLKHFLTLPAAKAFVEAEKAGITKSSAEARRFILDIITILQTNAYPTSAKYQILKQATQALSLIDQNVNSRIVLESFLLDLTCSH